MQAVAMPRSPLEAVTVLLSPGVICGCLGPCRVCALLSLLSLLSLTTPASCTLFGVTLSVQLPGSLLMVNVLFFFSFLSCFFLSHASECVPSLVTNSASLQKCLLGNSLWSLGFGIAKKMRHDDLPTQLAVFCWCWSAVSWYYHHFGSLFFFFLRSKNSH